MGTYTSLIHSLMDIFPLTTKPCIKMKPFPHTSIHCYYLIIC